MAELIGVLVEGLIALVSGFIELIAGIFTVGGEALGAGEALLTFAMLLAELIFWLILFIIELLVSLFYFKKPQKVKKPVFWRNKKEPKNEA